ncbi:hypothetical protein RSAG8_10241, partial [Rhizoctonia solani AG-8 WAC10335]
MYPDALAHVCSFWRRVALTTPSLWTHIDIALDHSLNPGLFSRAKVYAIRASQLPIDIHILDPGSEREKKRESAIRECKLKPGQPGYHSSYDWDDLHDFRLLNSDTSPIKTLHMDLRIYDRLREIHYSILEYFFAHCRPGVLTQYIVDFNNSVWWNISRTFIEPAETPHSLDAYKSLVYAHTGRAVPNDHLEDLWHRIPSIQIAGLCPHWKSKAYHGLVELCIDEGVPEISELQLINILRSNPMLQVFRITAPLDGLIDSEIINPVYLEHLRDLNVMVRDDDAELYSSRVLRQIAPGARPLQLSLSYFSQNSVVDFFSRANVTRLYIEGSPQLGFLFDQCPRLDILVLNELEMETCDLQSLVNRVDNPGVGFNGEGGEIKPVYKPASTSGAHIDTLYLLWHCEFAFEEICAIVEGYSVQRLIIYDGQLSYQTDEGRAVCENSRNIKAKLSTIPIVLPSNTTLMNVGMVSVMGTLGIPKAGSVLRLGFNMRNVPAPDPSVIVCYNL